MTDTIRNEEVLQATMSTIEKTVTPSGHEPAEFDVVMTDKMIFDMLLYHMYSTFGGFCLNIAGLTAVALGGIRWYLGLHSASTAAAFIILGILMVIITPITLKMRAKDTMKQEKYNGTLHYSFNDYGIDEVLATGTKNHYEWAQILKAVNTPKTISFYLEGGSVLVFPKVSFSKEVFLEAMWHLSHNVVMGKIYIH